MCGRDVVEDILHHLGKDEPIWKFPPRFALYKAHKTAYMPVEFSVAAYSFGHSMVRPIYRLNTQLHGGDDPNVATQSKEPRPSRMGSLLRKRIMNTPSRRFICVILRRRKWKPCLTSLQLLGHHASSFTPIN